MNPVGQDTKKESEHSKEMEDSNEQAPGSILSREEDTVDEEEKLGAPSTLSDSPSRCMESSNNQALESEESELQSVPIIDPSRDGISPFADPDGAHSNTIQAPEDDSSISPCATDTSSSNTPNPQTLGDHILSAASEGRLDDVVALLGAGVDVNYRDSNGWTPLAMAALNAQRVVLSFLLVKGADVNAKDDFESTALYYSAFDPTGFCAMKLIEAGADVHYQNVSGDTPLHNAARLNSEGTVLELLRAGAQKDVRNIWGFLPFEVTTKRKIRRILRTE